MEIKSKKEVYIYGKKYYIVFYNDGHDDLITEEEYKNKTSKESNEIINDSKGNYYSGEGGDGALYNIFTGIGSILFLILIYLLIKIWYSLPWILGLFILIIGVVLAEKNINSGSEFCLGYALLGILIGSLIFVAFMFVIKFFSYLGHITYTTKEIINIHETSGLNRNMNIGLFLTIIGSFCIGGFISKNN